MLPELNPDAKNPLTRLTECLSLIRARNFHSKLRRHNSIEWIVTGGGGNPGIECLNMCVQLLKRMAVGDEEALNLSWAVETLRL